MPIAKAVKIGKGRNHPKCPGSDMPAPLQRQALCNDCGHIVACPGGIFTEHWWPHNRSYNENKEKAQNA